MNTSNPARPASNKDKFRPQNVADPEVTTESPRADGARPADTEGKDLPRGSEPETRAASSNRR